MDDGVAGDWVSTETSYVESEVQADISANRFKNIMIKDDKVVVLDITTAYVRSTLSFITLDLKTMGFSDFTQIGGTLEADGSEAFLVRTIDGEIAAVWTERGKVHSSVLQPEKGTVGAVRERAAGMGTKYIGLVDVGFRANGFMLGTLENDKAQVFVVDSRGARVVNEFPGSVGAAAPVYSGSCSGEAFQFAYVFYSFVTKSTQVQTFRLNAEGVEQSRSDVEVPFDMNSHGVITSVALSPQLTEQGEPTLLLSSSSGAIQLVPPKTVAWTREEGLADLAAAQFVDLGEPATEETLETLADESFPARIVRHIGLLKEAPGYVLRFIQRLTSTEIVAQTPPLQAGHLNRDQFGLQKLIVAVTKGGKVFALDSANGNALWTRNLGFFTKDGPELDVLWVGQTRNVSEAGNPQLAVVATRTKNGYSLTLGYHIDAFTGEVAGDVNEFNIPLGKFLCVGRAKSVFVTPFINCCTRNRVLGIVDADNVLSIFPKCKKVANALEAQAGEMFWTQHDERHGTTTLRGFAPGLQGDNQTFTTQEVWSRAFSNQAVLDIAPLTPSETASFGRALGDKSVLYKYMNPHLTVVTSVTESEDRVANGHIYVIDTVTGSTVYEALVPSVQDRQLEAAMVENWLVYAWLEAGGASGGWRLGSVELYEDAPTNSSAGRSSLATTPRIRAQTRTFILQTAVRGLGFTTSTYGVTAKDLVFITSAGQVAYMPRRLLDPRRPEGKPTKAEQEEMLIPYDSLLPTGGSSILSHVYPVLGLEHLVPAPSLLESSGLLLAYGTDLFCTRALQPSGTFDILGQGFNKLQLLVTLAALGVGVAVARPAVARKNLKEKWFN